jgi:hypothetical protein
MADWTVMLDSTTSIEQLAGAGSCTRTYRINPDHYRERIRPVVFTEQLQREKGPTGPNDPALPEKQRWWNEQYWVKDLRVTRECFYYILSHIDDLLQHEAVVKDPRSPPVTPAEALAITLYFLARGGTQKAAGDAMGRGQATVSKWVPIVCDAIWERLHSLHIKFPNSVEGLMLSVSSKS